MAEFLEAVLVGLSELLIRARMEFLGSAQDLGSTLKMFSIQPILTAIQNWIAQANWISLIFFLFGGANIAFLIHETLARYKGVKWVIEHPIPAQVKEFLKDFILSENQLRETMAVLRQEVEKGLNPRTKESSSVKCYTTYVQDLPTARENGKFLALDLGGSNFRVLLVTLAGKYFNMKSKVYAIPEEIMLGSGDQLFGHIANCLHDFVVDQQIDKENLPLGFTFSFPVMQYGLKKAVLQRWTKGFKCGGVEGQDVVEKLKNAIQKRGGDLKVNVIAILNDTTGTLMSCAWKNIDTKIGVILGTGTNACYIEKIENVPEFDGDTRKTTVLINTEWGAFGDNGELSTIRTKYDKDVDGRSINCGQQLFEKLISGMYLGEIVRLILIDLVKNQLLFDGKLTDQLQKEHTFLTKYVSSVERDKRGTFRNCRRVMSKFGYDGLTDSDCHTVRYVCACVSRRAAHLASAGLAALINKMAYPSLTIGVDGSLYRFHPYFHCYMVSKISQLVDNNIKGFTLMLSSDGSGRGAALVAASAIGES